MGEGYLVPYKNTKKNVFEAQFIPGYRGLQNLARRSGKITECYAKAVCEKDFFEVEEGTERKIVHKPNYTQSRGTFVCFYAVFKTVEGNIDFEVMSIDEINDIRKRSKASEDGPWVTDFAEMSKKTVMRRLLKRAPMSIELAKAVEVDNKAAMGEIDDPSNDIIDLSEFDLDDAETPAEIQGQINAERTTELRNKIAGKTAQQTPANSDFSVMIQQELTRSGNPLTKDQVLAYVDKEGIVLTMDMDFHDLCEKAAAKSDSLL
jgi:recombination protein RecT